MMVVMVMRVPAHAARSSREREAGATNPLRLRAAKRQCSHRQALIGMPIRLPANVGRALTLSLSTQLASSTARSVRGTFTCFWAVKQLIT